PGLLDHLRRLQSHVLSPALPRRHRHASAHLHIQPRPRLGLLELLVDRRRLRHRLRRLSVRRERPALASLRGAGGRRPVGWPHARVANVVPAAAGPLRRYPTVLRPLLIVAAELWRPPTAQGGSSPCRAL